MGYYIDQLAEQDNLRRLQELEAFQALGGDERNLGNYAPEVVPQNRLEFLAAASDPNNTLRSEGFDPSTFSTTANPNAYMPPPPMPQNYIRNERTGKVTDLGMSQPSFGPALDYASPIEYAGMGKGYRIKGDPTRAMINGRMVDMGRDTGAERTRMKEDLAIEKLRAEVENSRNPYQKEVERQKARVEAEKQMAEQAARTPGTPEYARIQKEKQKADAIKGASDQAKLSIETKLNRLLGTVGEGGNRGGGLFDQAMGNIGFFSTGLTGQILGNFGGTDAYDLETSLEPIKANLTMETINEMKKQSPTGATGLGQIAIKELEMLQGAVASLKKEQSEKQLRQNMGVVKQHLENWEQAVRQAKAQGIPTQGDLENDTVPTAASGQQANAPRRYTTKEYQALPSGTQYIHPDGSIRTKR